MIQADGLFLVAIFGEGRECGIAVWCSVVQCGAVCYSVLQCVAI